MDMHETATTGRHVSRHAPLLEVFVVLMALPTVSLLGQAVSGAVSGVAFSTLPHGEKYFLSGVAVELISADASGGKFDVMTEEQGRYSLSHVPPGLYHLKAQLAGMKTHEQDIKVLAGEETHVDVELAMEVEKASVSVSATATPVETTETTSKETAHASTLVNVPNIDERFESALPLLPGVVRGPDGLLNVKGARATQGGVLVNSTNVTDPYTGGTGMNLPIDVVQQVQVQANPYDSGYGKFAGAVTVVDTRTADFSKRHYALQNFLPRLRHRAGHYVGFESVTPRFTFTGPVWKDRVAITQSFEYRFVRTRVPSLPDLENDTGLESFDSYTQVDVRLRDRQTASFTLAFFPQKLNYLGLNTFLPQPSAPDLRQRGHLLAFQHKYAFGSGSILESVAALKSLDANLKAHGSGPFQLGIETTTGSFFGRQDRDTDRLEWQETYHWAPRQAWGQHLPKVGIAYARNSFDGTQRMEPVDVLRLAGPVAERITFGPAGDLSVHQSEYTAFAQDRWTVHPRLTLDFGTRLDRDTVGVGSNWAPRVGFAFAPTRDTRTVLRGGAGYFYDRITLGEATFLQVPVRTVSDFSTDGSLTAARTYYPLMAARLRTPRSLAWNLELDREVAPNWYVRTGFQQRNTTRGFFLDPVSDDRGDSLTLFNSGRDRYREFEATLHHRFSRGSLTASYVHSSAVGDLNDFNQFYGNNPLAVIRPNERRRLAFDAPDRFLFWGEFSLPGKITFSPVLDAHTGFPYSDVDEERNFVGPRNEAGRFPAFTSLDAQLTKQFSIRLAGKRYKVRAGVKVFNLLNNYNPRDFQDNLASPRYGCFFNSVGRILRGKFLIDY